MPKVDFKKENHRKGYNVGEGEGFFSSSLRENVKLSLF